MNPKKIDFYFDFISVFSFFAWLTVQKLAKKYERAIIPHPVLFAGLLNHWGQLGPAEIPPKRRSVFEFSLRYAKQHDIPFNPPKYHPFNPLSALRLSLKAVSGEQQHQVIQAIFDAGWKNGADLGNESELMAILNAQGIQAEALLAKTHQPEIKQLLKNETQQAIAKGVFGVPTIIIDDQLFWGNDQMEYIELYLQGKDSLDQVKLQEFLNRPRAVDRPRTKKP